MRARRLSRGAGLAGAGLALESCRTCGAGASVVESRAHGAPTCKACALERARANYSRRKGARNA